MSYSGHSINLIFTVGSWVLFWGTFMSYVFKIPSYSTISRDGHKFKLCDLNLQCECWLAGEVKEHGVERDLSYCMAYFCRIICKCTCRFANIILDTFYIMISNSVCTSHRQDSNEKKSQKDLPGKYYNLL